MTPSSAAGDLGSIDRRTYLGLVAGGALGLGGDVAAQEMQPSGEVADSTEPPPMADWSFCVSDQIVKDCWRASNTADANADSTGRALPYYTPEPEEFDVPDHEVEVAVRNHENLAPASSRREWPPEPLDHNWEMVVKTGTALNLVSAMYLPFIGSGYWRYTFSLAGFSVILIRNDWDIYEPLYNGDVGPPRERHGRWWLNPEFWDGEDAGFRSHGTMLYQPDTPDPTSDLRNPDELALITSARQGGPYARAHPRPEEVEEGPLSQTAEEAVRIGADIAWKELRNRMLIRGWFDAGPVRQFLTEQMLDQIESVLGATLFAEGEPPDHVQEFQEHFGEYMTGDWSFTRWKYTDRDFQNPVFHDRLFSVDVPPVEEVQRGDDRASRWSEFRVSDQYVTPDSRYSVSSPLALASNELSVRVPKLPRPENADRFGREYVPFCHVDDECIYTAPTVEPVVTVASPEVPWALLHDIHSDFLQDG